MPLDNPLSPVLAYQCEKSGPQQGEDEQRFLGETCGPMEPAGGPQYQQLLRLLDEEFSSGNFPAIANEQHDDAEMKNTNKRAGMDISSGTEATEKAQYL